MTMVLYFHTVALLCSVLLDSSHASALELLEEQPHPGTQERSTGNELASIPDLFPNRTLRLLDGESSETDGWSYNNTESDIYDDEQSSYGIDQFSNTTVSSYEEVEEYSYIENEPQSASNGNSSLIVDAQYSNITGASALGPTPRRPFPDCPVAFIVLAGFSGILTALTGGLVIAKRVKLAKSVAAGQTATDAYHIFNQAKTFSGLKSIDGTCALYEWDSAQGLSSEGHQVEDDVCQQV